MNDRRMAPQKVRGGAPEDSRSEASSTKEKQQQASSSMAAAAFKARRNGSSAVTTGSNLKDVTIAPTVAEMQNEQQNISEAIGGVCDSATPHIMAFLRIT